MQPKDADHTILSGCPGWGPWVSSISPGQHPVTALPEAPDEGPGCQLPVTAGSLKGSLGHLLHGPEAKANGQTFWEVMSSDGQIHQCHLPPAAAPLRRLGGCGVPCQDSSFCADNFAILSVVYLYAKFLLGPVAQDPWGSAFLIDMGSKCRARIVCYALVWHQEVWQVDKGGPEANGFWEKDDAPNCPSSVLHSDTAGHRDRIHRRHRMKEH